VTELSGTRDASTVLGRAFFFLSAFFSSLAVSNKIVVSLGCCHGNGLCGRVIGCSWFLSWRPPDSSFIVLVDVVVVVVVEIPLR